MIKKMILNRCYDVFFHPLGYGFHKKLLILIISIGSVYFFSSCSSKKIEVVNEFYENGQAKIVMTYKVQMGDSIPLHEIQYHKDGSVLLEGDYIDGLREGEWISHYADGTIWSKGYFLKGKRTGKSWVYYPSGKLRMKGSYENGKKVGKWFVYNEEGVVVTEDEF